MFSLMAIFAARWQISVRSAPVNFSICSHDTKVHRCSRSHDPETAQTQNGLKRRNKVTAQQNTNHHRQRTPQNTERKRKEVVNHIQQQINHAKTLGHLRRERGKSRFLDVGLNRDHHTRRYLRGKVLQVDVLADGGLAEDGLEDGQPRVVVGHRDVDQLVETPRPHESRVDDVRPVGGPDNKHILFGSYAVHLREKLRKPDEARAIEGERVEDRAVKSAC